MQNTFIFLRHGETIKDPLKPVLEWDLTTDTLIELEKLSQLAVFAVVSAIYTSREHKAIATARPFAAALNLRPQVVHGLEEVSRGNKFLTDEEFERLKREKLENRNSSADEGESSNQALARFVEAVEAIDLLHQDEEILVVSHGTILTLYFSHLKNDYQNIFEYWRSIPFCGVGIVKGYTVVKDFSDVN